MKKIVIIQALATLIPMILGIVFEIKSDQLMKLGDIETFKYSDLASWCMFMFFAGMVLTAIDYSVLVYEKERKTCKDTIQDD